MIFYIILNGGGPGIVMGLDRVYVIKGVSWACGESGLVGCLLLLFGLRKSSRIRFVLVARPRD